MVCGEGMTVEKWDRMSQAERMSSLQSRVNWITDELVVGLGRGNGRGRGTSLKSGEALGAGVKTSKVLHQ